jgi:hypothetical protein
VLLMAAFQFSNPIEVIILMIANYFAGLALHSRVPTNSYFMLQDLPDTKTPGTRFSVRGQGV